MTVLPMYCAAAIPVGEAGWRLWACVWQWGQLSAADRPETQPSTRASGIWWQLAMECGKVFLKSLDAS